MLHVHWYKKLLQTSHLITSVGKTNLRFDYEHISLLVMAVWGYCSVLVPGHGYFCC